MQMGLSTLAQIGSNYYMPVSDNKVLVVENDPLYEKQQKKESTDSASSKNTKENSTDKKNPQELSEDEKRLVKDLQARDAEVKAHEAAHQAAGGASTGGASYSYQQGPDGKMYAVGGEVSIAIKGGSTPQEEIANARAIIAAAMAPANPSGQDYSVANSAKVMEMKAQQKLSKEQQSKLSGEKAYNDFNPNADNSNNTQRSNDTVAADSYNPLDISA